MSDAPSAEGQPVVYALPTPEPLPAAWPGALPRPLTPLVGRERELTAIAELLQQEHVRLINLLGPGGTGKTRLALAVATQLAPSFVDGVAFTDLSRITDTDLVLPTIALALGVRESGGRSLASQLAALLVDLHLLLVIDNCEQVVTAPQITDILETSPRLTVLTTSRAPLRASGEHTFPVPPLSLPRRETRDVRRENEALTHVSRLASHDSDAIDLFVQRARAAQPDFQLTEGNAGAVIEICRQLDGLPLAIELAAARLRLLSPEALLARLTDRLRLLTGGPLDRPDRLQTMSNAIAWSHDLLVDDEQACFRRLAVFTGGFTIEAAERVIDASFVPSPSPPPQTLEIIGSLVDQSLIRRRDDVDSEPRFGMLETIRAYGLEQLASHHEEDALRQLHALHFLDLAERAQPNLRGPDQAKWLNRLEAEHDNFRAALSWTADNGEAETALRLAIALASFWEIRGYQSEGAGWLERTVDLAAGAEFAALRGDGYRSASGLAASAADYRRATAFAEKSLAIARERGDGKAIAGALSNLGVIAGRRDDFDRATALFEEALLVAREIGDHVQAGVLANNLGLVATMQGDHARAAGYLEESVTFFRELGDQQRIAQSLGNLAVAVQREGDHARAVTLFEETLAIQRGLGDSRSLAISLADFALLAQEQRDDGRAAALLVESIALGRLIANPAVLRAGLLKLAELLVADRRPTTAAKLIGAADSFGDDGDEPTPQSGSTTEHPTATAARIALGDAPYAVAWTAGRALSPDQAVAEAAQAAEELAKGGPDRPPTDSALPSIIANLTPREREVLRLLVDGRTDREIGEIIFVTTKTASNHVASILAKLDVDTRTAAASLALRHGLA